jgi:hypothetical protein
MAKTFELMEEPMPAPSGNRPVAGGPSSRVSELGIVLPAPPTSLGAGVESSDVGNLLFLSGMLPVVNRKGHKMRFAAMLLLGEICISGGTDVSPSR